MVRESRGADGPSGGVQGQSPCSPQAKLGECRGGTAPSAPIQLSAFSNQEVRSDSVIYALLVCSIVPILIIYPFIQKYFAKGVNMGGVKE